MERTTINNVKFLVITANIGSLFEEHGEKLQQKWVAAFNKLLDEQKPAILGLHLQEVGGKTYDISRQQVRKFFEDLYRPDCFRDYTCIQSYVDEEYHDRIKYTAMGCSYFVHKSLQNDLQQWSFNEEEFVDIIEGRSIDLISDESVFLKKCKFPISCYSKQATKLPRKGFTWSKWRIHDKVFVLVNIHLTHDACNINVTKKNNTKYAKYRKKSMEYCLEQLKEIEYDHIILFGDFNVRPDTKALLEYLVGKEVQIEEVHDAENGKPSGLVYRNLNGCSKVILTIEERLFQLSDYDVFNKHRCQELLKFDKELNWMLEESFSEAPITFRPTYPHKENPEDKGTPSFSSVRCPSWCDRILLDTQLYGIVKNKNCIYDTFGEDVILGDHKPVYMSFVYPVGLPADQ